MKAHFVMPLMTGAVALALAGCSSFHRASDRTVQPAGYVGQASTAGIPPTIDPFSASYVPFPVTAVEQPYSNHSTFCMQHYSQPGCQTFDTNESVARTGGFWRSRDGMRDSERR
ncbi:MAG: hypothetical protein ABIS45_09790, partial [Burkholderiales bacterium]